MKNGILTAVLIGSMALVGCAGDSASWGRDNPKETIGGLGGAALGGLAGSTIGGGSGQKIAIGAGVLLGALAGANIGRSLDRADKMYMAETQQKAHTAPIGETITWNNPESGHSGSVTPVRDGRSAGGEYCREYEQTIYVGGRAEQGFGTACQNPDGSWTIVN